MVTLPTKIRGIHNLIGLQAVFRVIHHEPFVCSHASADSGRSHSRDSALLLPGLSGGGTSAGPRDGNPDSHRNRNADPDSAFPFPNVHRNAIRDADRHVNSYPYADFYVYPSPDGYAFSYQYPHSHLHSFRDRYPSCYGYLHLLAFPLGNAYGDPYSYPLINAAPIKSLTRPQSRRG